MLWLPPPPRARAHQGDACFAVRMAGDAAEQHHRRSEGPGASPSIAVLQRAPKVLDRVLCWSGARTTASESPFARRFETGGRPRRVRTSKPPVKGGRSGGIRFAYEPRGDGVSGREIARVEPINHVGPAGVAQLLRQLGFRLCTPSRVSGSWRVHVTRSRLRRGSQRPVTDRHSRGVVFVRHGFLRRPLSVVQRVHRVPGSTQTRTSHRPTTKYKAELTETTTVGPSRYRMGLLLPVCRNGRAVRRHAWSGCAGASSQTASVGLA